jgi:ribulose-phosphate 3-epimerase
VHLMVKPVDRIIPDFAKAGANIITFHPEASEHVDRSLALIRETAARPAWCSIRRRRSLPGLRHGQARYRPADERQPRLWRTEFIPSTLTKLRAARARIDAYEHESGRRIRLEVDGGVKVDNIAAIARAGADTFVAGSAVLAPARTATPTATTA